MDFTFPTDDKRISVQVINPEHILELQTSMVKTMADPELLMQNMRITKVVANCYGDDVVVTISLFPKQEAKMILLRSFVQNVNNCRHS